MSRGRRDDARPRARQLRPLLVTVAALAAGTAVARKLGYSIGGHTVVRCRRRHLFTTLWIPGVHLKAIDLGIARIQRCPVGAHWSLVVPVRDTALSDEERRRAAEHRDIRIP